MKTLADPRDRAEIVQRLARVEPQSAAQWGRMSAPQMVCHLGDAFRMAMGQKAVSQAAGFRQRTLIKWLALYTPLRWPAGVATVPEIDQAGAGTCPGEFAADVADVVRLMEAFASQPPAERRLPHPVFGTLSSWAWQRWGYLHMDHHLRQFGA